MRLYFHTPPDIDTASPTTNPGDKNSLPCTCPCRWLLASPQSYHNTRPGIAVHYPSPLGRKNQWGPVRMMSQASGPSAIQMYQPRKGYTWPTTCPWWLSSCQSGNRLGPTPHQGRTTQLGKSSNSTATNVRLDKRVTLMCMYKFHVFSRL